VVRCAKRAVDHQAASGAEETGHGVDGCDLERFVKGQARQDAGHPTRHHRLARAGRTDEQQVVRAGRGDFERPPRQQLAAHIFEIGETGDERRPRRWRGRQGTPRRRILQGFHGVGEGCDRQHRQARDDGGLARVRGREEQAAEAIAAGPDGDR
jgi:hypothetical protein